MGREPLTGRDKVQASVACPPFLHPGGNDIGGIGDKNVGLAVVAGLPAAIPYLGIRLYGKDARAVYLHFSGPFIGISIPDLFRGPYGSGPSVLFHIKFYHGTLQVCNSHQRDFSVFGHNIGRSIGKFDWLCFLYRYVAGNPVPRIVICYDPYFSWIYP